jgi:hypothetical protein
VEEEIEVWWPRDTGPFRRPERVKRPRRDRKDVNISAKEPAPVSEQQPPAPEKTPRPEKQKRRHDGPRRVERPTPSDSPFAVLSELRARLAAKKS